jgi:hypothetical protein
MRDASQRRDIVFGCATGVTWSRRGRGLGRHRVGTAVAGAVETAKRHAAAALPLRTNSIGAMDGSNAAMNA